LKGSCRKFQAASVWTKVLNAWARESTFIQAMTSIRRNGLVTLIGIFEEPNITFNVMRFINYEIRAQGSQEYCWDFLIALKMSEQIDLEKLVTHEFPLNELQKAFETCFDPREESIKIISKP
jgi:threonine dehydrogenase-like Zn-dependent dehydrogenase